MTEIVLGGEKISHSGPAPYTARSASDRDPVWPLWFIADAVGFNGIRFDAQPLAKFTDARSAKVIAAALNKAASK